uniref:SJCHGC00487 protein n=1 Tax=Schistosoma japonicum TaxID=6182 RepID=Q5DEL9_SCHJA|nr:SJCHGC00487 protein [Schistosoma japonicum]
MARSFWRSSHYLEWLLDRQDVMIHRANDLKILGSEEEYQKVMLFFTDVIQAFGKSVEVRQQVIATALVYFKRFYSRNSFKTIDPWLMAPSCLFLASKVEEFGVVSQKNLMASCRNVVHSHYLIYFPDGYGYPYRAQDVLECEFILLEAMDCSLIVFHPYRPLVQLLWMNSAHRLRPQMHEYADVLLERAWWLVMIVFEQMYACIILLIIPVVIIIFNEFSLPISSNKHGYFAHQPQSTVNPSLVADRWFSELNVDMEKVLEVSRHLLCLYDLWRRFDELAEMPNILLKKLPRPVIQPPHTSQNYQSGSSVNATGGNSGAASQSSSNLSGGTQQQQTHGGGPILVSSGTGSSGATGNVGSIHAMSDHQNQQQQRSMTSSSQSRMHPQGGIQHMGVR